MKIFLIALAILLITGCELPSIIEADEYLEPIPVNVSENIPISDDVWGRIRITSENNQGYLDKKTIEYINVYLKNPDQLDLLFEKGRYFIYFVLEELERYSLPPELALLPYIESSYDPFSISSSGAMGIWQFMPATARIYGLKDTWWYEQRHDPLVSSRAAVRYLAYLHNRFNKDITEITKRYAVTTDVLVVIAETGATGGINPCRSDYVMEAQDNLHWYLENIPGVTKVISLSSVAKRA